MYKILFSVLCIICISFFGCVSKSRYLDLESDLETTHIEAEQAQKNLKALQIQYDKLNKDHTSLVTRFHESMNESLLLACKNDDLKMQLDNEITISREKDLRIDELTETRNKIEAGLSEPIEANQIKIEDVQGKLKITIVDEALFNSGSAKINKRGRKLLMEVAESFQEKKTMDRVVENPPKNIAVNHSLKRKFPSTWELSAARSASVARFLQEKTTFLPGSVSAAGYSYNQPMAANDTKKNRPRKIEIVLVPIQ